MYREKKMRRTIVLIFIASIILGLIQACSVSAEQDPEVRVITVIETNYTYITNTIIQNEILTNFQEITNQFWYTNIESLTNFITNTATQTNIQVFTNINWATNYFTNQVTLTNEIIQTNLQTFTNIFSQTNWYILTNFWTNSFQLTNILYLTNYVILTNYYTMTNSTIWDPADTGSVTLQGAVITNGLTDSALYFNGTAWAVLSNQLSVNFTGDLFTLSVWIKWDTDPFSWRTANDYANIISKNGDVQWQLGHAKNNRKFQFTLNTLSGAYIVSGTTQPLQSVWYHLAAVYDGNNLVLYVNGNQEGTIPATGLMLTSSADINIGRRSVSGDRYFLGWVDRLGIYSTAWNSQAVQFEYLQGQ